MIKSPKAGEEVSEAIGNALMVGCSSLSVRASLKRNTEWNRIVQFNTRKHKEEMRRLKEEETQKREKQREILENQIKERREKKEREREELIKYWHK